MHSESTVGILLIVIFANVWAFGQPLESPQLEKKSPQKIPIKYKLIARPSGGDLHAIVNIDRSFGAIGYVYKASFGEASNGTVTVTYVYINIDNSKLPYHFRVFHAPPTSAGLLKQLNNQGAMGFRYVSILSEKTVFYVEYLRDTARPLARYVYRQEPCVSNLDDLFAQINKNAAQGYRVVDSFRLDNFCVLYIKDTSQQSEFVYKRVSDFNNTADLLSKADDLGAQGYRYVGYGSIELVSNGKSSFPVVPLYYRDKTQRACTFSYSSAPVPDSPANLLAPLQEQETKGFIYCSTFSTSINSFLIFVKFHNCHYKSMNIDAYY